MKSMSAVKYSATIRTISRIIESRRVYHSQLWNPGSIGSFYICISKGSTRSLRPSGKLFISSSCHNTNRRRQNILSWARPGDGSCHKSRNAICRDCGMVCRRTVSKQSSRSSLSTSFLRLAPIKTISCLLSPCSPPSLTNDSILLA
jgi:hypothetical protein